MNYPFLLAVHNTVFAFILALIVYGLTRIWPNPPVAHLLWLLVLLKLVTPPILRIDCPAHWLTGSSSPRNSVVADLSEIKDRTAQSHSRFNDRSETPTTARQAVDRPEGRATVRESAVGMDPLEIARNLQSFWHRARPFLLWCWIGGACLYALIAATCIVRFNRCLRGTFPAPERLQQLASQTAHKIGLRRAPDVRYANGIEVPMLWCAGRRPIIVSANASALAVR